MGKHANCVQAKRYKLTDESETTGPEAGVDDKLDVSGEVDMQILYVYSVQLLILRLARIYEPSFFFSVSRKQTFPSSSQV